MNCIVRAAMLVPPRPWVLLASFAQIALRGSELPQLHLGLCDQPVGVLLRTKRLFVL